MELVLLTSFKGVISSSSLSIEIGLTLFSAFLLTEIGLAIFKSALLTEIGFRCVFSADVKSSVDYLCSKKSSASISLVFIFSMLFFFLSFLAGVLLGVLAGVLLPLFFFYLSISACSALSFSFYSLFFLVICISAGIPNILPLLQKVS